MIAWNFQRIVGTCQFRVPWFGYPCGYSSLTLIAVDEDFQANHLGTIMLDYIKAVAVINGFIGIRLEVHNDNINAIRFYEHNNFVAERRASNHSKYMKCNL